MGTQTPADKREKARIRKRKQRNREKSQGSQVSTSSVTPMVISDEDRAAQQREKNRIRKQRSRAKQAASWLSQVTLQYCNSAPVII